jgi:pimeloyl-ACP methyl ester carboxylesterase
MDFFKLVWLGTRGFILFCLLVPSALVVYCQSSSQYANINGLHMYYEIHGKGQPLLLLHGGSSTIDDSFSKQITSFASTNQVIAPEQMGHGHTADSDMPLSYMQMMENTAELLKQLGLKNADVVGWSDGGIIALMLAIRHPELVRRVVASGANIRPPTGAGAEGLRNLKAEDFPSSTRAAYGSVSPDGPGHFPVLFEKLKQLWLSSPTSDELSSELLGTLKKKVLVVAGDHDVISLEETIEIFESIPGAELCILPATHHHTFGERPEWINNIIMKFFAEE